MSSVSEPASHDIAVRNHSDLYACRRKLDGQLAELKRLQVEDIDLRSKLEAASARNKNLQNGQGLLIDSFGPVVVYEFWIQVPGYSGPIQNASASLIVHGTLQTVGDVSNKQKSGLAGFVVGGALLGPVGAISGTLLSRKNTIKTAMREIDTRKLELKIQGVGFAWSKFYPISDEKWLMQLRDNILSRGSSELTCEMTIARNRDLGRTLKKSLSTNAMSREHTLMLIEESKTALDIITLACRKDRLTAPIRFKLWWTSLPATVQSNAIIFGPVLSGVLALLFIITVLRDDGIWMILAGVALGAVIVVWLLLLGFVFLKSKLRHRY